MASCSERSSWLLFFGLFLHSVFPAVAAFDGGDAVALLLGVTISVVGVCACLGWYARKRSGQL
ncbi:small integral membrane protein 30-like [Polypterus senegalus]|uniref:small integral membrane protein 30-like n=1 Tax=Polypterus senegalus TaxID=55291 RepID=UPI001962E31C|nr:small integral membrane protein 30-like [Polypterus senegalus]